MNAEELAKTKKRVVANLKYAERVLNGDTEYDGADGARDVAEVCYIALDLIKELEPPIKEVA